MSEDPTRYGETEQHDEPTQPPHYLPAEPPKDKHTLRTLTLVIVALVILGVAGYLVLS